MSSAPFCKFCGTSHFGVQHATPKKEPPPFKGNPKKLINPDKIEPAHVPISQKESRFKNGKSYSKNTMLYKHNCYWCGKEFKGSLDKRYCSDNCRLVAWRNFKKESHNFISQTAEKTGKFTPLSWGKTRFAVLQRDHFQCRYCGRSANDGYVLHVDHIHPKSKGGTNNVDNLVTSCMECNLSKGSDILSFNPFVANT